MRYFGHFLGFMGILEIFRLKGILVFFFFRGILVNFRFRGYFGHFLGLRGILEIFSGFGVFLSWAICKNDTWIIIGSNWVTS